MPPLRSLLAYLLALVLVFAGAGTAGFVYQHEPERDARVVELASDDPDAVLQTIVSGEIVEVGSDFLVVRIEGEEFRLAVPTGAALDQLVRVEDPSTLEGRSVNLGGQQTVNGLILTGIVAIGTAP